MSAFSRLRSELAYLRGALRTLNRVKPIKSTPNRTVLDRLEDVIAQNHNRVALISEDETLSYGEMGARINRIARWARAHGIGKGNTVALFLPNRPDYLCIWLGIARAGGATGTAEEWGVAVAAARPLATHEQGRAAASLPAAEEAAAAAAPPLRAAEPGVVQPLAKRRSGQLLRGAVSVIVKTECARCIAIPCPGSPDSPTFRTTRS